MSSPTSFAAEILEASASAYAGLAASLLVERRPEVLERYAPTPLRLWKSHLRQRILELSAALGAEEPRLFVSRVRWAAKAFRAREMDERDLRSGLACLREVLTEELPEPARDATAGYLDTALESFDESPVEDVGLRTSIPLERRALRYLEAALKGDGRRAVDLVAGAVDDGLAVAEAYEVLLAAQREAGRMWHLGELEVVEEHVVTATTERAMSVLAQRAAREAANGKAVIAGAVADNSHGLAVRMLADFFEIAGWRSICLGADVPASDLATAVVYFDADLLALSAALPTQLKALRQAIETVRALPDRDVKIMVGGLALAEAPELWRRLGADGSAPTADSAVALGLRLVGLEP